MGYRKSCCNLVDLVTFRMKVKLFCSTNFDGILQKALARFIMVTKFCKDNKPFDNENTGLYNSGDQGRIIKSGYFTTRIFTLRNLFGFVCLACCTIHYIIFHSQSESHEVALAGSRFYKSAILVAITLGDVK